ncbi:MAG: asparagine synthase C-terminal domain-containing protein, partial [Nitrosopumilaceae archaeon]
MEEICLKLEKLVSDAVSNCKSDCIALSGGLDSSILAFCLGNKKIRGIVTVTKDFPSVDLVHSQLVAKQTDLQLDVKTASIVDLVHAIEETIKILKVFNPIEIRNSIVMYLTMNLAKEKGFTSIITGDGADELFAGYSFFQRKQGEELQKDLERIWKVMHFPTLQIGKSLGIDVQTPFLNEKVVEYAKSIPADLKVHQERGKKYGKWILRKAFEKILPESITWREKSAMQDGSGTAGLTSFF